MPGEFDPYHEWLGIPSEEQPPDLYRILGIKRFESNPIVIENAAARQMAHLRLFQAGPRGSESQRLLNEVAQARNCLIDPKKRAAYDAVLRQNEAPPQTLPLKPTDTHPYRLDREYEPAISAPRLISSPVPLSNYTRRATRRRTSKRSPAYESLKVITGGAVGIVIAVGILHYHFHFDFRTLRAGFEKAGVVKPSQDQGQPQVEKTIEEAAASGDEAAKPAISPDRIASQASRARSPADVSGNNQNRGPASGFEMKGRRELLNSERESDMERGRRTARSRAYAALPDLEQSGPSTALLFPVITKPEDEIQLALFINDKTIPSMSHFSLQKIAKQPEELFWQIDFLGDGTGLPLELAQLKFCEDGLHFLWLDNAKTHPDAKYLANGVLRVQINRDFHEVQLRRPIEVAPATMELNRGIAAVRWELPEAIDLNQCYIECLGLEKGLPDTTCLPVERLPGGQGELWIRLHGGLDETGVVLHVHIERGRQVTVTVGSYYFIGDITPPPQLVNNRDARITTSNRRRWAKAIEARVKQAYEVATRLQSIDASSFTRAAERQEFLKRKSQAEQVLQEAQTDMRRLLNIDKWAGAMYQPVKLHFRVYFEVEGSHVDVMYTQGAQLVERDLPTHPATHTVPR